MAPCRLPLNLVLWLFPRLFNRELLCEQVQLEFCSSSALPPLSSPGLARQQQCPCSLVSRGARALCHLAGARPMPGQAACHCSLERCSLQLGEQAAHRAGAALRLLELKWHTEQPAVCPLLCISFCMAFKIRSSVPHQLWSF